MRVAFLFGAGVSVPIINVGTRDITHRVLDGSRVFRFTDSRYYYDEGRVHHEAREREAVERLVGFLNRIKADQEHFYTKLCVRDGELVVTHEDLAYACDLIAGSVSGELENPALEPYVEMLSADITRFWSAAFGIAANDRERVGKTAAEALAYIQDVASAALSSRPAVDSAMRVHRVLLGACSDPTVRSIDICTLNQDSVLEALLDRASIPYVDGFEMEAISPGVRRWNPELLDRNQGSPRVSLLKLHGSIDWYRLRLPNGSWHHEFVGRVASGLCVDRLECATGGILENPGIRPLMLVGVFNKIMAYTTSFYVDLFATFWRSLRRTTDLVVSGYSFRDKGVNARLTDWIAQAPEGARRLIVIHREPARLRHAARGAIRKKWDGWIDAGVLRVVERDIQDCDWNDVRPLVHDASEQAGGAPELH